MVSEDISIIMHNHTYGIYLYVNLLFVNRYHTSRIYNIYTSMRNSFTFIFSMHSVAYDFSRFVKYNYYITY